MSNKAEKHLLRKAILFILGGLFIFISLIIAVLYFAILLPVRSYLSSEAFPIEHIPFSREAENLVRKKTADFIHRETGDTLILNSEEVNHLIRTNQRMTEYRVQYLVELQDSLFNLKCSAPAGAVKSHMSGLINFFNLDGYINAEMEGYVRLREGKLTVVTTRSQMNGREAPFTLLGKRTHIDVGKFFKDRAEYEKIIKAIKSVWIRDRLLVMVRN